MGNENEELLRHEKALNLINDEAKLNKYIEDYNLKKYIDKFEHEKKSFKRNETDGAFTFGTYGRSFEQFCEVAER